MQNSITRHRVFFMANEFIQSEDDILVTRDLKKYFPIRGSFNPFSRAGKKFVRAVDGVSLSIPRGKTVAVVGESGCGKTTLARAITLLTPPTSGQIIFNGIDIVKNKQSSRKLYRDIQM